MTAQIHTDDVRRTAVLNDGSAGTGFALNQTANFEPSAHGPLVYLHVTEPLDALLARVEQAGGKIVRAPEPMGEGMGPYAMFADSEGSVFAFYADA
jgi:predicted enzyme related to lactoylglutathione lyase